MLASSKSPQVMRCELLPAQRVLASPPEIEVPTRMLQCLDQLADNMLLPKHRGAKVTEVDFSKTRKERKATTQ